MINAYKSFWTRAFDFKGVTNRPDFWWAVLANWIVYIVLIIISGLTGQPGREGWLPVTYSIIQIIPNVSIAIRRVRDVGKSWQWIFIHLIPLVGVIWFFTFLIRPSVPIA